MKYCRRTTVVVVTCAGGMICPLVMSQTPCDTGIPGIAAIRETKALIETAGDRYGTSVGLSGDMMVSGAPQLDGTQSGFAIIHSRHQGGLDGWGEIKRRAANLFTDYSYLWQTGGSRRGVAAYYDIRNGVHF